MSLRDEENETHARSARVYFFYDDSQELFLYTCYTIVSYKITERSDKSHLF